MTELIEFIYLNYIYYIYTYLLYDYLLVYDLTPLYRNFIWWFFYLKRAQKDFKKVFK